MPSSIKPTEIWVERVTTRTEDGPLGPKWAPCIPARSTSLPPSQQDSPEWTGIRPIATFSDLPTVESTPAWTPNMTEAQWFGQPSYAASIYSQASASVRGGYEYDPEALTADWELGWAQRNHEWVGSKFALASTVQLDRIAILPVSTIASPADSVGNHTRINLLNRTSGRKEKMNVLFVGTYRAVVEEYKRQKERMRDRARRRYLAKFQNKPLPEIPKPLPPLPPPSPSPVVPDDEIVHRPSRNTFGVECRFVDISLGND